MSLEMIFSVMIYHPHKSWNQGLGQKLCCSQVELNVQNFTFKTQSKLTKILLISKITNSLKLQNNFRNYKIEGKIKFLKEQSMPPSQLYFRFFLLKAPLVPWDHQLLFCALSQKTSVLQLLQLLFLKNLCSHIEQ